MKRLIFTVLFISLCCSVLLHLLFRFPGNILMYHFLIVATITVTVGFFYQVLGYIRNRHSRFWTRNVLSFGFLLLICAFYLVVLLIIIFGIRR